MRPIRLQTYISFRQSAIYEPLLEPSPEKKIKNPLKIAHRSIKEDFTGICTTKGGDRFEGKFDKDSNPVSGTLTYKCGDVWVGKVDVNEKGEIVKTRGTLTTSKGFILEGKFEDGELFGNAEVTFPSPGRRGLFKGYFSKPQIGKIKGYYTVSIKSL